MASEKLGAGTYRVRKGKTLVKSGKAYKEGELVQLSDAGAGAHHKVVERVSEAELAKVAEKAAAEKAAAEKAEKTKASSDAKKPASTSGKGSN